MKKLLILLCFLALVLGGCAMTDDIVVVETNKGTFEIQLYDETPETKANFLKLVNEGFYDGLTFHRYEPGFVIQGGDPSGDGTSGSSETISLEIAEDKSHTRGTVGMARSQDPNSASSQFYVNLGDNTFLDNNYAVFGDVISGMEVADELRAGDVMTKVYVK